MTAASRQDQADWNSAWHPAAMAYDNLKIQAVETLQCPSQVTFLQIWRGPGFTRDSCWPHPVSNEFSVVGGHLILEPPGQKPMLKARHSKCADALVLASSHISNMHMLYVPAAGMPACQFDIDNDIVYTSIPVCLCSLPGDASDMVSGACVRQVQL